MSQLVLSGAHVAPALAAREAGRPAAELSPDLGLTTVEVTLEAEGVRFPSGELLTWKAIDTITSSPHNCFTLEEGVPRKVQAFSPWTNRQMSLMPTDGAPTLVLAGFPMHRIKGIDPYRDTLLKVKALAPIRGRVLDTATGLGYTAIEEARTAEQVVTIEIDPAVLEIARINPWSRALFGNPRITQLIGDASELVETLADESFSRIMHDPPTLSLGGELYSGEFYHELFRVLRPGGRLFHYIGDLESAASGRLVQGVTRRLREAGFERVRPRREAYGLVAFK